MKVMVTGGGGFVGGAIIELLLKKGHQVRSFSRGDYPSLRAQGVETVSGDLTDAAAVSRAASKCEAVFHVAAKVDMWGKENDFVRYNVLGTKNVIEACRANNVGRLIFTSTPSVVFAGRDLKGADESTPFPLSFKAAYPRTKAIAEKMVLAANDALLSTVAIRPHLVWGPGDNHLIPGILERGRIGALRRIGAGDSVVDFTHVDNVALAHVAAMEKLSAGSPLCGKAYFISQEEPMRLWDFADRVLAAHNLPPVNKRVPYWAAYLAAAISELAHTVFPLRGEPRLTRFLVEEMSTSHWFNISAAKRDFGYRPVVSMEQGFARLRKGGPL